MTRNLIALLAVSMLAACGKPGPPQADSPTAPPGAASPEQAFESLKAAAGGKDWATFLALLEPGAREAAVLFTWVAAGFVSTRSQELQEELAAILKRHGAKESRDVEGGKESFMADTGKMRAVAGRMFRDVRDLAALQSDLAGFFEKHDPGKFPYKFEGATLRDLKVDGEVATGRCIREGGREGSTRFVRRDGRWYLALSPDR